MPVYEYICPKCQAVKSELISVNEVEKTKIYCDVCKPKKVMKRNVGKPRFTFKGGSPTRSRCPE